MRYFKKLGLAIAAVAALGAVMASAAVASDGIFTAEKNGEPFYPAIITGEQEPETQNYFEVGGIQIGCEEAKFSATLAKPTSTLTIHPTYHGCETSLGTEMIFDLNSCDYVAHAGEAKDEEDDAFTAT